MIQPKQNEGKLVCVGCKICTVPDQMSHLLYTGNSIQDLQHKYKLIKTNINLNERGCVVYTHI